MRSGGVLAVEDADFDGLFCDPPNEGFEFYQRIYRELIAQRGGDHATGRKLRRYFREADLPGPELTQIQGPRSGNGGKPRALLTLEGIRDAILAARLAEPAEIGAALASLRAFTDDPQTILSGPRIFQAWTRRG